MCYFDDVNTPDHAFYTEVTGELLAIDEFNQSHPQMRISRLRSLPYTRPFPEYWHIMIYVAHDFGHPRYADDFYPKSRRQLRRLT